MKISSLAALCAAVYGAALIAVIPAAAAPTGSPSAADTVTELQTRGYRVVVHKEDRNARLDNCTVRAIRPARIVNELTRDPQESIGQRVPSATYTTVHVDTSC